MSKGSATQAAGNASWKLTAGFLLTLLLSGLLSPSDRPARGEELPPFQQEPVVVTATRIEQPASEATSFVTVIPHPEIERSGAMTVGELLRRAPGVGIFSQGSPGEEVNVRVRGAEYDQVLVLLDGVRLNSPLTGEADLGDLLSEGLERVEVVRGGLSALWGSEAMGGVVNLITRLPARAGHGLMLAGEGGNLGGPRGRAQALGRTGPLGYSLSLSHTQSEGQFQHRDELRALTLAGLGELRLSPGALLRWTTRYVGSHKELAIGPALYPHEGGAQLGLAWDANRVLERSLWVNALTFHQEPTAWWSFQVQGSHLYSRLQERNPEDRRPGSLPLADFLSFGGGQLTLSTQHNLTLGEVDLLSVGAEVNRERASLHERPGPGLSRFTRERLSQALWGQSQLFWGERLILNLGLRWDRSSKSGGHLTPRASLGYSFEPTATRLRAGMAWGFRAPSFAELYAPGFGRPELDPEKSRTLEVGLEQSFWRRRLELSATHFATRFSNLIEPNLLLRRFENQGQSAVRGIELALSARPLSTLELAWSYTWLETQDRKRHRELPLRPRHGMGLNAHWTPGERLSLDLSVEAHSRQRNPDSVQALPDCDGRRLGRWTSGYARLRLAASYPWRGLRLQTRMDNLLDEDHLRELPGMPSPGLNFWVGLLAEWGESGR